MPNNVYITITPPTLLISLKKKKHESIRGSCVSHRAVGDFGSCRLIKMQEPRRIVILGKTGSGISQLGNTIFGENVFQVDDSSVSGTQTCLAVTRHIKGRDIKLIDTPGFFDTDPESKDLSPELIKCITECAPGPHAFLLVLKVEKYTRQEQAVVDVILKYFSEEALKYTTVVFTHGDDLPENMRIEDWVTKNQALSSLIEKCGGRVHVFDSRYWKNSQDEYRNNQVQIQNLLKSIEQAVKQNGGKCYTNEFLKLVSTNKHLVKLAGVSTGILLGALLGLPAMVAYVFCFLKNNFAEISGAVCGVAVADAIVTGTVATGAVAGGAIVAGAAITGGVIGSGVAGGWIGFDIAKRAETLGEPVKEAAKTVLQEIKHLISRKKSPIQRSKYSK